MHSFYDFILAVIIGMMLMLLFLHNDIIILTDYEKTLVAASDFCGNSSCRDIVGDFLYNGGK